MFIYVNADGTWYYGALVYTICYKKPPTSHLYAYKYGTVVRYKKRTITYTYIHIPRSPITSFNLEVIGGLAYTHNQCKESFLINCTRT